MTILASLLLAIAALAVGGVYAYLPWRKRLLIALDPDPSGGRTRRS